MEQSQSRIKTMMIELGNSKYLVSRIGLGLAALGRPGYINIGHSTDLKNNYSVENMKKQTHKMLEKAVQLNINYFDVAQSYGKGEEFLSSWLNTNPDKDVIVSSKWGYYYTADWKISAEKNEIKDHSLNRLKQQWPISKKLLDTRLKIYQIHSATFESGVLKNVEVLEELERIKSEGYIIGLTVSGVQQSEVLKEAFKIKLSGKRLFGSVQATYNILEQSVEESLMMAHELGIGVLIKEAVANGKLTNRNKNAEYFDELNKIAHEHNAGIDAVAIAYLLTKPFVNTIISGAATESQLVSNLKAQDIILTETQIQKLNNLRMNSAKYWEDRSQLAWN